MAGFGFTEAQEMFRRQARDFAQKELAPLDKGQAKQEYMPRDIIKKLADTGFLGIAIPEEWGGQGGDWISAGIAVEELGKASLFAGFYLGIPVVAHVHLEHAPEKLRDEWLPQVIRGEKVVSWGITEPEAGSDAAGMRATAVREGQYYILNGEKTSITLGYEADACILLAKTDPKAGARGISCFWVPLDLPGISRSRIPHTGWKPMVAASIALDGVRIPAEYRCGEEGRGFHISMGMADFGRIYLGLLALARAETSLDEAIAYAVQRTAFGQPIARFEGVSFKIAEHATLIEATRMLCYRTLWLKDQGLPHTKESAMCKWLGAKVGFNAIHDALLIHGHVGYSEEYPLEQRLRDAVGLEFTDGMDQIMKIVIARELMGRTAVPY